MELYYKDLISEDASLDKLVDDLMLVVQGADDFAAATGAGMEASRKEELATRLRRLKEGCRRLQGQAAAGARATDKFLRANPYPSLGFGFAAGVLAGLLFCRRNRS